MQGLESKKMLKYIRKKGLTKRWLFPVLLMLALVSLAFQLPVTAASMYSLPTQSIDTSNRIWLPVAVRGSVSSESDPNPDPPQSPTPTPTPTPAPEKAGDSEWTQDGHDAMRTGYTSIEPLEPWTLLWTWNGPDNGGGPAGHFYDAPPEARTITGGSFVFVPAGVKGIYSLRKSDGSVAWHVSKTAFVATPAYDPATGFLYAGGADGILYKLEGSSGKILGFYNAGAAINKALLLADGYVFIVVSDGKLVKVKPETMNAEWIYQADSTSATPAAYSPSTGLLVYGLDDLTVRAVRVTNGSLAWMVKPTNRPAVHPYTYAGYWPVITEQHGIVFIRLNLGNEGLWSGPGPGNMYPQSNNETRDYLVGNPQYQNLFALNLNDGSIAFIPAVGFGGVEGLYQGNPELQTGPPPVVKTFDDGSQVAYQFFRSGQGNPPDGRWDTHLGEMVLDGQTIAGLAPGDLRFVDFANSYTFITDEQSPLSMAGKTIFHAHWGASESARITDRTPGRGLAHADPIQSITHPPLIRRQQACQDYDPSSHWTTCGLTLFDDGRYWEGPGWWAYWNVLDPPTPSRSAYSEGILPRYTYVSGDLIVIEGNGGELFVFQHSGNGS